MKPFSRVTLALFLFSQATAFASGDQAPVTVFSRGSVIRRAEFATWAEDRKVQVAYFPDRTLSFSLCDGIGRNCDFPTNHTFPEIERVLERLKAAQKTKIPLAANVVILGASSLLASEFTAVLAIKRGYSLSRYAWLQVGAALSVSGVLYLLSDALPASTQATRSVETILAAALSGKPVETRLPLRTEDLDRFFVELRKTSPSSPSVSEQRTKATPEKQTARPSRGKSEPFQIKAQSARD